MKPFNPKLHHIVIQMGELNQKNVNFGYVKESKYLIRVLTKVKVNFVCRVYGIRPDARIIEIRPFIIILSIKRETQSNGSVDLNSFPDLNKKGCSYVPNDDLERFDFFRLFLFSNENIKSQ